MDGAVELDRIGSEWLRGQDVSRGASWTTAACEQGGGEVHNAACAMMKMKCSQREVPWKCERPA